MNMAMLLQTFKSTLGLQFVIIGLTTVEDNSRSFLMADDLGLIAVLLNFSQNCDS
jgi:hypothetical protein